MDFKFLVFWEVMNSAYLTYIIALGTSPVLEVTQWQGCAKSKKAFVVAVVQYIATKSF